MLEQIIEFKFSGRIKNQFKEYSIELYKNQNKKQWKEDEKSFNQPFKYGKLIKNFGAIRICEATAPYRTDLVVTHHIMWIEPENLAEDFLKAMKLKAIK